MKFCSNCGRHYKDTDNFCKECGIELKQGAEDSSSFSELKDSASQALAEAGNKAKEALSEENRQKIQQKASGAADSLKNMDAEKGKQMLNQGVSRFHALSANIKKIIAATVIIVIAFGGYEYFSPERQITRAIDHSVEVMSEVVSKTPDEFTDSDIKKFASLYPEQKRPTIIKKLEKARDNAAMHPNAKNAKNEFLLSVGADMLSGVKVKSVTVHGNSATVVLVNQNGARIGTQPMKKVDGNWYLANLPGDRDSD